jgi:D-beta-D-heptose 7-phosphate kinase / D-beta-D-heptose 1-phosphate adenosyltransferase
MNTLLQQVNAWGHPQILVVGDLMLDRYTWGDVERVSPEAPVMVLRAENEEVRLGGAGSVAALLRGLEAEVSLAGVIGSDASGHLLLTLLREDSIDHSLVVRDPDRRTTTKDRFLGRSASCAAQQMLRVDYEDRQDISEQTEQQLFQSIANCLGEFDAVLISDYAKGVCTTGLLRPLIAAARQQQITVLVDPGRGVDFDRYLGATVIKPNRLEAQEATGIPIRFPLDAMSAGGILCSGHGFGAVLVTLDRDGMVVCTADGAAEALSTHVHHVCDITGAGDMVLATLGLALAQRMTLSDAAQLANLAAGMEVERQGVAVISRNELVYQLNRSIRSDSVGGAYQAQSVTFEAAGLVATANRDCFTAKKDFTLGRSKLIALEEARNLSANHRLHGRTVVFTNGCFDLLHIGHVTYLEEAANLGHVLIVAVNSDRSVQQLKGTSRPVVPQNDRAAMLAALSCVDHVLIFDDLTPHQVLSAVRPDVLVKGGTTIDVIGREVVEGYGGRVQVLARVVDKSTTQLVLKIKDLSCT